jgi:hypothetical protein
MSPWNLPRSEFLPGDRAASTEPAFMAETFDYWSVDRYVSIHECGPQIATCKASPNRGPNGFDLAFPQPKCSNPPWICPKRSPFF